MNKGNSLQWTGNRTKLALALVLGLLVICGGARGQAGSASISGTIVDAQGGLVPNAQVQIVNTDTNVVADTKTNAAGVYNFPSLNPGSYRMLVTRQGFKQIDLRDVVLHTQDSINRNFTLDVGGTSETIVVTATNTTNDNPAVSVTVSREFVEDMPLNGRSFQDLIQLAPGTVSAGNGSGYYSSDGQRTDSSNFTVDGVSANLGGINNNSVQGYSAGLGGASPAQTVVGTTQSLTTVDALQEFTIQTSGYTAEFGRNPGGQVQLTTRSGTNHIHGSAFDYLRNTAFDANSWYNDYHGDPQTAEHQNDFGGTVGGPLVIPKLYDGKDKTFFFFSYEGLRLLLPTSESKYVPTQAFRNAASPNVQPFLDAAPLPNTSTAGDSCTVSGSTINLSGSAGPGATPCDEEFYYGYSYPESLDSISARVDENLGPRFHAFVRYADTPSSRVTGAEESETGSTNVYSWTAGLTTQISGELIDEFRMNYSHDEENQIETPKSVDGSIPFARDLLIPAAYDGPFAEGGANIYIQGTELDAGPYWGGGGSTQRQLQLIDSLAWTKVNHTLKFGADWRRLTPVFSYYPYESTLYSTTAANIQQGYATELQIGAAAPGSPVFDNLSLYAEDQWKIRPRLTLSYGLRWEFNPPPGPSNGHYPATLTSDDLATAQLAPLGTPPYKSNYHSFAPRLGFAWNAVPSPNHPLTVRGGFGIFFDTGQTAIGEAYAGSYPFGATGPTQTNVPLPLSNASLAPPSLNFPLTPPYPFLEGISTPNLTLPYTEQWNLSVDEALNSKNTLTVSYVGNNGRKLLFTQYYNGGTGNPAFASGLQFTNNLSASSYNALQVQDGGRIANGLDLVASFTWAHALDNASTDQTDAQAPWWGNSNYDLRRVLNLALNYQTPTEGSSGWAHTLTHGWVVANRFAAQSGYPLSIIQTNVYNPDGSEAEYAPDLIPGVPIYLHGNAADVNGKPVPGSWRLNRAAFAAVPTDPTTGNPVRQGTLGRNFVRNPGFWNLNTSVQRSFPIHDELHLILRIDAFNIFNHPNLGGPQTYLPASTFGQLGGTTTIGSSNALYAMGAARSFQFSLKLQF